MKKIQNGDSIAFSFKDPKSGKQHTIWGYKTENKMDNNAMESFLQHEVVRETLSILLEKNEHLRGLPLGYFKR